MSEPWSTAVTVRVALTLAPALLVWLVPHVRMPGLDPAFFDGYPVSFAHASLLSVFALGLKPIFSAFLVVEVLALAVPRWRPLRHGGPAGRARLLTAAWRLSVALAATQALGMAVHMERMGLLEADTRLSRLVVALSIVAGTCLLVVAAHFLDRFALGGGFSLLSVAFALPAVGEFAEGAEWLSVGDPLVRAAPVAGLVFAAASTFVLLRHRVRNAQGWPSAVRLPACGLVPLRVSAAVLAMAGVLAQLGVWPALVEQGHDGTAGLVVRVAFVSLLAAVFSMLFNRGYRAATEGAGTAPYVARTRRVVGGDELARAGAWSTAYVLGLAAVSWLLEWTWSIGGLDVVPAAMLTAVLLDVIAEARALRRHGPLVAVWPEHRVRAVDEALSVLERAGIPALARSVHHRTLWHFFAPFIPIQLLVPAARGEEASRLLHEHFLAPEDRHGRGAAPAPAPAESARRSRAGTLPSLLPR